MKRIMVRYRIKPGQVEENERLVRAVYAELHRLKPAAMRYATFRLADGHSFVHLHDSGEGASAMTDLESFQDFQRGIGERCEEAPVVTELTEIGSYDPAGGKF